MMRSITVKYTNGATNQYNDAITGTDEWACNQRGEGVFIRKTDGTWHQMAGTGQTPMFRDSVTFRRFLRSHFGVSSARIVEKDGWP